MDGTQNEEHSKKGKRGKGYQQRIDDSPADAAHNVLGPKQKQCFLPEQQHGGNTDEHDDEMTERKKEPNIMKEEEEGGGGRRRREEKEGREGGGEEEERETMNTMIP